MACRLPRREDAEALGEKQRATFVVKLTTVGRYEQRSNLFEKRSGAPENFYFRSLDIDLENVRRPGCQGRDKPWDRLDAYNVRSHAEPKGDRAAATAERLFPLFVTKRHGLDSYGVEPVPGEMPPEEGQVGAYSGEVVHEFRSKPSTVPVIPSSRSEATLELGFGG
jgi:hypothetical protein